MNCFYLLLWTVLFAAACSRQQKPPDQPPRSPAAGETAAVETVKDNWMTDFEAARVKAKAENKHLLLDFTGSDWCGWCMKLDKEVFSTPEFKAFADANLILVKLDFPRRKPQSDAVKAQNQKLQVKYGVEGYPTLVILDPDGKEVGQTGYRKGGAEPYVKHLQEFLDRSDK